MYNGLNRRIQKTTGGSTYDSYFNNGWKALEIRKDGSANPWKQYVWSIRYIDAVICRFYDANTDGLDIETLYYCNDANMNVTTLVNTSGAVQERYEYDPYGKVTIYNSDWSATVTWANSKKNEVLYCGYRYDPETGLYHIRNRMYHIYLGWLQRDPLRYADGMSLYQYVTSNPCAIKDPLGLTEAERAYWKKQQAEIQRWIDEGNPDAEYHRESIKILSRLIYRNTVQEYIWKVEGQTKEQMKHYKKEQEYRRRLEARGLCKCPKDKCHKWFMSIYGGGGAGAVLAIDVIYARLRASEECSMGAKYGYDTVYAFAGEGFGAGLAVGASIATARDEREIRTRCIGWEDWNGWGRVTTWGTLFVGGAWVDTPQYYGHFASAWWWGDIMVDLAVTTTIGKWEVLTEEEEQVFWGQPPKRGK